MMKRSLLIVLAVIATVTLASTFAILFLPGSKLAQDLDTVPNPRLETVRSEATYTDWYYLWADPAMTDNEYIEINGFWGFRHTTLDDMILTAYVQVGSLYDQWDRPRIVYKTEGQDFGILFRDTNGKWYSRPPIADVKEANFNGIVAAINDRLLG